jgi:hypothetical protein
MPGEPWELNNKQCPLCGAEDVEKTRDQTLPPLGLWINCATCGSYGISRQAARALHFVDHPQYGPKHILSGVAREGSDRGSSISITTENVAQLLQSASIPSDPIDAMNRILLYVQRKQTTAADFVELADRDYPIAFAKNGDELDYYVDNLSSMGYLEAPPTMGRGGYRLTPNGWQRVIELRKQERDSDQAFVAMWFDTELDTAWNDGFMPALEEVGYHPIRIDLVPHNDKICDRIEAEIRRSGLVVADMTGNRGGVYFEAGLAKGLGIPVIWTCRQDYVGHLHFDTRQYNHIVWTDAGELKESLVFRIEATIPGRVRTSGAPAK